jgi:gamma-glutamyltranspeptidase/glutathione hydrolase
MHHQWLPDTVGIERSGAADDLLLKLRAMGHTVTAAGAQGDANSIGVDPGGTAWGASDKRSADGKTSVARLTSTASRQ